jgi:hypothetical protein
MTEQLATKKPLALRFAAFRRSIRGANPDPCFFQGRVDDSPIRGGVKIFLLIRVFGSTIIRMEIVFDPEKKRPQ